MRGAIPLLPQYVFMAWCLVKHRDFSFTFTFYFREAKNIVNNFVRRCKFTSITKTSKPVELLIN
jgi:hypothetical protein